VIKMILLICKNIETGENAVTRKTTWFATGRWFSPVSSTNKSDRHNITEILLKMTLNTITLTVMDVCNDNKELVLFLSHNEDNPFIRGRWRSVIRLMDIFRCKFIVYNVIYTYFDQRSNDTNTQTNRKRTRKNEKKKRDNTYIAISKLRYTASTST
jgi:hypothetical protein